MTFLVARIEHAVRRTAVIVKRALAETCSGFSDYESGDYLTDEQAMSIAIEETRAMRRERAERTRQQRVDQEAEEEVAEPAPCNDIQPDFPGFACTKRHGHDGDHGWEVHGTYWPQVAEPSYVDSPHGWQHIVANRLPIDMRIGDQYCRVCGANITAVSFHACPVLAQETSAVPPAAEQGPEAVSAAPSPAPASGAPAWPTWAVPAICDVLAGHSPFEHLRGKITCVGTDDHFVNFADWQDWRDHVSDLIAARLDTAWRAKQSREGMETGRDMGSSFAAEFFPQHQKHTK